MQIDGRAGCLNKVHIMTADTVVQLHVQFTVWKALDGTGPEALAELRGDCLGQGCTRWTGKNRHVHRYFRYA